MIAVIQQPGRLELIDANADAYPEGTIVRTTGNPSPTIPNLVSLPAQVMPDKIYEAIVTGADFDTSQLRVQPSRSTDQTEVAFTLMPAAARKFAKFTTKHSNTMNGGQPYYICIVLDNRIESCPTAIMPIMDGQGVITIGSGGVEEANRLVDILRYGQLPIDLKAAQVSSIPLASNADATRAYVIAGIIGLASVMFITLLIFNRRQGSMEI